MIAQEGFNLTEILSLIDSFSHSELSPEAKLLARTEAYNAQLRIDRNEPVDQQALKNSVLQTIQDFVGNNDE